MKNSNRIIDLTYLIEEGMTTFNAPWHTPVSITQMGRIGIEGRETRKITFGTHTGTHIDAPLHFIKNGKSVEQIPLEKLIGEISIIDFSKLKQNQPITKEMLQKLKIGKKIIFKFNWEKFFTTKKFYENYPYFTKEAAQFLVSKNVELIGLDTPSPDNSEDNLNSNEDSPIHKILLKNGVVLVEYLANLDKIKNYNNWKIFVMPLKLKGCDGSPARVILHK